MEDNKYVKLEDVKKLLELIKLRDSFYDWSTSYEKYDEEVKIAIKTLEDNAVNM